MADKKLTETKLNSVRNNAGEWRSRVLKFPDATGLRPTPERVRQTVFNWLGQDLTGFTCLDLFAGTGVMGFEALSRGATSVKLVEKSTPAYRALIENKQLLKADQAQILHQDAMQFVQGNSHKFNLIFLDPPYNLEWLPKILPLLSAHVSANGFVYVEAEYALDQALEAMPKLAADWKVIKQSKAGNVFYHLLKLSNDTSNT